MEGDRTDHKSKNSKKRNIEEADAADKSLSRKNEDKKSSKRNGRKINSKDNGNKKGSAKDSKNIKWVILIWVVSFILSGGFSIISSGILSQVNILVAVLVLVSIIFINIIFDTIGTASTAADETPFHSMAARKVKGAKEAIKLIKNADKVSNFCNDVIGDICGILSGAASTYIVMKVMQKGIFTGSAAQSIVEIILTGLVASLTVGGKSIGKTLAINNSNNIIFKVALLIRLFKLRITRRR